MSFLFVLNLIVLLDSPLGLISDLLARDPLKRKCTFPFTISLLSGHQVSNQNIALNLFSHLFFFVVISLNFKSRQGGKLRKMETMMSAFRTPTTRRDCSTLLLTRLMMRRRIKSTMLLTPNWTRDGKPEGDHETMHADCYIYIYPVMPETF